MSKQLQEGHISGLIQRIDEDAFKTLTRRCSPEQVIGPMVESGASLVGRASNGVLIPARPDPLGLLQRVCHRVGRFGHIDV